VARNEAEGRTDADNERTDKERLGLESRELDASHEFRGYCRFSQPREMNGGAVQERLFAALFDVVDYPE
jgi:transcription initiation factor TFIID subunit TAF12